MPDEKKKFEELTIKFGKGLAENFTGKDGKPSRRTAGRSINQKASEGSRKAAVHKINNPAIRSQFSGIYMI